MRASFGYGPTALLGPCGRIARRSTVRLVKAVIVFTLSSSTAMPPKRAARRCGLLFRLQRFAAPGAGLPGVRPLGVLQFSPVRAQRVAIAPN
jgi:hypothetical protein